MCQWGYRTVDACKVDRNVAVAAITYFDRFLSFRGLRVVEDCVANHSAYQLAFIVSWTTFCALLCKLISWLLSSLSVSAISQSCLVIALKGREGINVSRGFVKEIQLQCKEMYNIEEINQMEFQVLNTLSWRLNGPTPQDFIHCFMELLPTGVICEDATRNLFKEAVAESETVINRPGSIWEEF